MNFTTRTQINFNKVADKVLAAILPNEEISVNFNAEETLFVRFNNSKVRQTTSVEQTSLEIRVQFNGRTADASFNLTGNTEHDQAQGLKWLEILRKEIATLPEDPYQVPMTNNGSSESAHTGKLLAAADVVEAIVTPAQGCDFAGLYTAGPLITANRNSKGQSHWFATESFFMDFSIYNGQKAVKGVYAGTEWKQTDFVKQLESSKAQLALMDKPKKVLQPGAYRTYLAPGAVAEIAGMFRWEAMSYNAYKQGNSSMKKLADKEKSLSPKFSLRENFGMGLTHRFNSLGELAPENLDLIKNGELANFMVSSRSAKEYGVTGNAAEGYEGPRSMEISSGTLAKEDILKELGTGLYLSNLHYINWSDRPTARITGMTRYACFWVENGEIVAPIADLRFDESMYDCFGENLEAVTNFQDVDPEVGTYHGRSFGGKKIPGMLIKDFKFTL
jgi:Predicted Zn-dependent proteases and their inactivated homologs